MIIGISTATERDNAFMKNGFLKVCTPPPALRVADCAYNTQETIAAMQQAAQDGAALAVFPGLGSPAIPARTCFCSSRWMPPSRACGTFSAQAKRSSSSPSSVCRSADGALYATAPPWSGHGALLGLVPKTHLPNYAEFYELRHFPLGTSPKRAASHRAARPFLARTCCSAAAKCRISASAWRSARFSGPCRCC